MSAYDTDYDSDTSGETPIKRQPVESEKCKELEVIKTALNDVLSRMEQIRRQISELENIEIYVTESNVSICKDIRAQLCGVENNGRYGRQAFYNVMDCLCVECNDSCHLHCLRCAVP